MKRFNLRGLLSSVRSRVGLFALAATLLPSVTLGWLSYDRHAEVLQQKAAQEINSAAKFAVREIDLWLKDRVYEIRVIGSSYLITEDIQKYHGKEGNGAKPRRDGVTRRMQDYLRTVNARFPGFANLQVNTLTGELVASASGRTSASFPDGWLEKVGQNEVLIGEPSWDAAAQAVTLQMAIPLRSVNGAPLGALLAQVELHAIEKILADFPLANGEIYVITSDGSRIMSSLPQGTAGNIVLTPTSSSLFETPGIPLEYKNYRDERVVGELQNVSQTRWAVVVEQQHDKVFAQVHTLRNTTLIVVASLLIVVGIGAYWIGLTLVHPLDRLVAAANRVSAGDLDVRLPIVRRDELGHLSERFNDMTAQLQHDKAKLAEANDELVRKNIELEAISITDGLTSLYNRRYLMEVLDREFSQHARTGRVFSLLLADLDHFKRVNDNYGHLAGDAVLLAASRIFRDAIRGVDYAARFGGEEFVLILMDTGLQDALVTAERIRERIAETKVEFDGEQIPVTISIGLSEVGHDAHDTPTALIARADKALYQAKDNGRNAVQSHAATVHRLHPKANA